MRVCTHLMRGSCHSGFTLLPSNTPGRRSDKVRRWRAWTNCRPWSGSPATPWCCAWSRSRLVAPFFGVDKLFVCFPWPRFLPRARATMLTGPTPRADPRPQASPRPLPGQQVLPFGIYRLSLPRAGHPDREAQADKPPCCPYTKPRRQVVDRDARQRP